MKAIKIFFICLIGFAVQGIAQQMPQFTNYMQNDFLVNPAAAGKNDHYQISVLNRYQWVGITDAPRTFIVSVDGPNKRRNMGFGAQVYTDITGPTRRIGGRINYSYHMKLGTKVKLAFGVYGGLLQYGIDASKIKLGVTDVPDIISTNYQKSLVPDFGAGTYLYQKDKFYFGVGFPQLFKANLKFDKKITTNSKLSTLVALHGGYTFDLGNKMAVEPSVLMKYEAGAPINLNAGFKFIYDKQHWLGVMYKGADGITNQYIKDLFKQNNTPWTKGESVCMLVGMTYKNYLSFGYAYDYSKQT
jgi:type IX secretion system PorP/SprF family membrane protein